jgi:hypothetical protein
VPISVLSLDLDEPVGGWVAYLTGRAVEVLADDLGRPSISRADARQLFDEHREAEVRKQEVLRRQEEAAVEADRVFRSQLPVGLSWLDIPEGSSAAEVWRAAELAAQPRRRSMLEEALSSDTLTYHPLPKGDES